MLPLTDLGLNLLPQVGLLALYTELLRHHAGRGLVHGEQSGRLWRQSGFGN